MIKNINNEKSQEGIFQALQQQKIFVFLVALTIVWLFIQFQLWGFMAFLWGLLQMILLAFLVGSIRYFLIQKKYTFSFLCIRTFLIFGAIAGFFASILWAFSLYHNTFPAHLGRIVLTNWERSIVFFQMSHIATPEFYQRTRDDIISLTHSGYIVYAEGVRPGTQKNTEAFQKLLGLKLTDKTYTTLANTIGMEAQDQSLYAGIGTGSLRYVDISIDDIMSFASGTLLTPPLSDPLDLESEIARMDNTLTPYARYVARSFLNFSLKIDERSFSYFWDAIDPRLLQNIIEKRNTHIVDTFLASSDTKAVFVYGALHFDGIYRLLTARDSRWKILEVNPLSPYGF